MSDIIKIATRESYGKALAELGKEYDFLVFDADLAGATKTSIFKKAFPDRHIDCGIAEANMTGIAAGVAATGIPVFISSFAMFASGRNYEQVRNSIGYPHLNVKIGATHAGITVGEDGATHQCLEDIALMREIPGMTVIVPSDDIEARAAVKAALLTDGPMYIRFGRSAVPVINTDPDYDFVIGKARKLREGSDITIFTNGVCVSEVLDAATKLALDGIDAEVVNIHTVKPLDTEAIISSAAKTGRVFTVEEHFVTGGLGSAVAECISSASIEQLPNRVVVTRIGINDEFGQSGKAGELLKYYKLDADGICEQIKASL